MHSTSNARSSVIAPWIWAAVVACVAACSRTEIGPNGKPLPRGPARRVVLITCDSVRADHLSCYGYARPTTPYIDRLAAESMLFQNAWSTAPVTTAALSSMLTGTLPTDVTAVPAAPLEIQVGARTLAEVVRDAGIDTAAFVSTRELARAPAGSKVGGIERGFARFDDESMPGDSSRMGLERSAKEATVSAMRWLAERGSADDRFFLWVHYADARGPYAPSNEHLAPFVRDHSAEPELPISSDDSSANSIPKYQALVDVRRAGEYVDRYDAAIHEIDAACGRLLTALHDRGWLDDTLVIVTADHGEALGEKGSWFCHGANLQREVLRVPLIVRPPHASKDALLPEGTGKRSTKLSTHLDVWPTVLESLGIEASSSVGVSLLGTKLPSDRVAVQFQGPLDVTQRMFAIDDGRWRLVRTGVSKTALFDTISDPTESVDVAEKYRNVATSLMERYEALVKRSRNLARESMR